MTRIVTCLLTFLFTTHAFAANGKLFQRIILVVLENTNYENALKQPFQASLLQRGALLSNYNAVTHPSQPNYIALISGSTQGVYGNQNVNLPTRHLGDLLEEKGLDWRTYAEGYPGNCFLGATRGAYARKHVPFLSFINVQRNPSRCAKVVPATEFDTDVAARKLAAYSLYVPDLRNDGHDTSPAFSDNWLKTRFGALLDDPTFMEGTLFVVTYDENEDLFGGGKNQVYTALVGPMVRAGAVNADSLTHYSLLKLVEENWSLDPLTREDAAASAINGIWN